ncbi:SMG9-like [Chlorella sorokiniana]|uniref:SMG9-like n=1 Tax=Chlorella sorokiniana TaxID=3076 RepID=A0A2P6U2Z5_CHLSO|nr:SMG9-like [Chlorella sorokiniana]|eukprot:PRW60682.1 SMG9-like [Chlorella sorokiniana]
MSVPIVLRKAAAAPGAAAPPAAAASSGALREEEAAQAGLSGLQAEPAEPYSLLDADTWQVLPAAVAELLSGSSTDFYVVGALGPQGLGKSTLLNALLGFSGPLPAAGPHSSPAFPTAAAAAVAAGRHCTRGLGLRVGAGRLIGLDAQPLFSASVLEDMMATWLDQPPPALAAPAVAAASEAKAPAVPYEGVQALAQLQLAVLLLSACHRLLVFGDGLEDSRTWEFLATAEMLTRGVPDPSLPPREQPPSAAQQAQQQPAQRQPPAQEHLAEVVLVHMLPAGQGPPTAAQLQGLERRLDALFAGSRLCRPGALRMLPTNQLWRRLRGAGEGTTVIMSATAVPHPAGGGSAVGAPPLPRGPWKADRMLGIIGLSMWLGTTFRVWPVLPPNDRLQCCLGLLVMYLVSVAWPSHALRSYLQWRVPALAFLRVFLFALPFNFSTQVFDAIAPAPGTGRLAVVSNLFQVFLACRIALLTFTSLGWRLPHRLHMVVQAVNVLMLIRFGMHSYCKSKLLSSPELEATTSMVHNGLAFTAMAFVPSTAILVPEDPYAQRIAFLLICWLVLGWLLPTLLLLPDRVSHMEVVPPSSAGSNGRAAAVTRVAGKFATLLEAWLRLLAPSPQQARRGGQGQGGGPISAGATLLLHWWAVVMVCWAAACSAAPLFLASKGLAQGT